MAKRGPKPAPLASPRVALSADVPRSLKGDIRRRYAALAAELAAEGYACQCDWRTVAMAAKTEAHLDRLEKEIGQLDSLTVVTEKGIRLHPLLVELRATRSQLASLYGLLFLQPKARATSRISPERMRGQAVDELGEFLKA